MFCGDRLDVGGVCVKVCEVCFNVMLAEIYLSCCSYVGNEMVGKRKFGKEISSLLTSSHRTIFNPVGLKF